MLMCCSSCVRLQDQNTDAADVDADDVAFEDDEEAAGDGEGGDALGPRAQASKPAPKLHGFGGLRGWLALSAGPACHNRLLQRRMLLYALPHDHQCCLPCHRSSTLRAGRAARSAGCCWGRWREPCRLAVSGRLLDAASVSLC